MDRQKGGNEDHSGLDGKKVMKFSCSKEAQISGSDHEKGKMKPWRHVSSRECLKEPEEEVDHEEYGVMTSKNKICQQKRHCS